MQTDPAQEWRRLAEEYREMGDGELFNLAEDFANLTGPAQEALRQEMRSRGLGDPQAAEPAKTNFIPQTTNAPVKQVDAPAAVSPMMLGQAPVIVANDDGNDQEETGPHDYTWKTVLCDCGSDQEARELAEALRQAGLDSWVQGSQEFGRRQARVLVAADQLDRAREIAARPIAKEAVDESQEEVPEFIEPKCPKCGSDEVVLEGADTQNHWRCEACEAEWSDDAEGEDGKPANGGETSS